MFKAASLAAPRPSPDARPAAPIIVAGALSTASGLGESARLCYAALKSADLPVMGVDLAAALMQPQDLFGFEFIDASALEGPGTLILHVNSPLVPLAMLRLGPRFVRGKYIIGYWAWELPQVPPDWRHGVPFVHEIWAPSTFTAQAIRPVAPDRPIRVVPHPVALSPPGHSARSRRLDAPFTVLTIFNAASGFARKNPLAAIAAFGCAFGDDPSTRLIVKASNLSAFPQGLILLKSRALSANNIVLIDKTMSVAEIDALYDASDVLMSLHRSEGFGLTLAEAMLRGLPVVATSWSGNADFLTTQTGIPIPYRLVPAHDPQGTYHHPGMSWADADVEAAAAALRRLREDRVLRARLGRQAAEFAARAFNAATYAAVVRQHLGL